MTQYTFQNITCFFLTVKCIDQKEIIVHRGYPLEVHHVVTEDGYILELHRIPFGKRSERTANSTGGLGRPVFLQHGMMATDHFWLFNPSNISLGINLTYLLTKFS